MVELKMNTNDLTVVILAAGYGRRMGHFSRMVNKGLIPYGDKPLISHIIDKFPEGTKYVIACGHLGQQVKNYVGEIHKEKNIVFVDIPDYSEGNTGPATTIQHCAKHIDGAFMWLACDTLFDFDYKSRMDENWIGVYPVDSNISQDYCWVKRDGDDIVEIHNKEQNKTAVDAFIGLMYAKDDTYLKNLQSVKAKETCEGFLDNLQLKAHTVKQWLDFGTFEKWQELTKDLQENSFVKPDEIFYHDNNKVIKYFTDEKHVTSRVARANANPKCMPTNIKGVGNFLVHDWTDGDIIYNQADPQLFKRMLLWCDKNIWVDCGEPINNLDTHHHCHNFYFVKTQERLAQFRVKYPEWSECTKVNNVDVRDMNYYLNEIDWIWLSETVDWRFIHGDLHFDNTIYDPITQKFTSIDWRTDFSGQLYGDIYYDLAKMLGGIRLSYKAVKDELLEYTENNGFANIVVPSVSNPEIYEEILRDWAISKGLNWYKVQTLVPLIYLNMSPLHEAPFDKFLFSLSQLNFSKIL
jgi:NDP-sugar pyrophosphorylase family protein